jgi:hypothetical protein
MCPSCPYDPAFYALSASNQRHEIEIPQSGTGALFNRIFQQVFPNGGEYHTEMKLAPYLIQTMPLRGENAGERSRNENDKDSA